MTTDVASMMHFLAYGKSDSVNAAENQNAEFQAGYAAALASCNRSRDAMQCIHEEWRRRGSPETEPPEFREWKRGFWACRNQTLFARAVL